MVNAAPGRGGQPVVRHHTGVHARPGRVGLQEIGGEALQRVVPVVIARDSVDRLREPLEGEIKLGFVIQHRARGIDHVRGNDQKLHVRPLAQEQILIAQAVLGGPAFAGIAEHQETEVGFAGDPFGRDLEKALFAHVQFPVALLDSQDHLFAPDIGACGGPVVPDPGGPALAVEKPAESPDGIDGNQNGGQRQTDYQAPAQGGAGGITHPGHPPREAQAPRQPARVHPADQTRPKVLVDPGQGTLPAASLQRTRQLAPGQPAGKNNAKGQQQGGPHIAQNGDQGRNHADEIPFHAHAPDMDGEEYDHEGPAPGDVNPASGLYFQVQRCL